MQENFPGFSRSPSLRMSEQVFQNIDTKSRMNFGWSRTTKNTQTRTYGRVVTCIASLQRTAALMIVSSLQEKYKTICFASVNLENACDHMYKEGPVVGLEPQRRWMDSRGRVVQSMHSDARIVCGSMVSVESSLVSESMCTRARSLALCSSSWSWKHFGMKSALVCSGSLLVYAGDLMLIVGTQENNLNSKLNIFIEWSQCKLWLHEIDSEVQWHHESTGGWPKLHLSQLCKGKV